eukprot:SAG31_NODE_46394_length_254_cov_1.335484_1_plen_29_part_10
MARAACQERVGTGTQEHEQSEFSLMASHN